MEELPEKIDSKYRYVLLAALRAEQQINGSPAKVDVGSPKPTRRAMREISRDLVDWDYGPAEEPEPEVEETEADGEAAAEETSGA